MSRISQFYPYRKWVILFSTFYLNLVVDGYCFIFGILMIPMLDTYSEYHLSAVAWIGGIVPLLYNGLAPIGIALVEHFGSRSVTIAASLLSSLGFTLCWMNETFFQAGFWFDFMTLGVIEGLAFALLYGPSINTIPTFFDHKTKSLAIGITTCGSAAGAIFFGFIVHFLIEGYGWRGTLLAFSCFSLNGVLAALSFPSNEELALVRSMVPHLHHHAAGHAQHHSKKSFMARYFDLSHFSQCSFILVLIAATLSMGGYYVPVILVPSQSRQPEYGVSPAVQSKIILIWGCANLCGRLVSGRLADYGRNHIKLSAFTSYWIFILGHSVSAAALLVFPHVMLYGTAAFVSFVVVYGFFIAPLITMRSVLVADLYGEHNSSSCFGWFLAVQGASQLFGYALPTFLDTLDSVYSYLFGALCFAGSAICVAATGRVYFSARKVRFAERLEEDRLRTESMLLTASKPEDVMIAETEHLEHAGEDLIDSASTNSSSSASATGTTSGKSSTS